MGQSDRWPDRQWTNRQVEGHTDRRTEGQTDGQKDKGWTDRDK